MAAVPLFRDTNIAAVTSRENTPWSQALRQAKTSFGNVTLLLWKTRSIFCYCFYPNTAVFSRE